jgi:Fe-S-cluster containining protein
VFFNEDEILHIPIGINFDCTGCGNCCLQWPVPSTDEDRRRIIDLSREFVAPVTANTATGETTAGTAADIPSTSTSVDLFSTPGGQLFRRIDMDVLRNKNNQFQYTMEKRADGRCVFLTQQNRCALHERFGVESKPSMCQLFPYTFTEAPDGFYASISFASTGALFNQGTPLADQREHLLNRMSLFKKLFPALKLDWSQIQLVDGIPIRWAQYLLIERPILAELRQAIESTEQITDSSFPTRINFAENASSVNSCPPDWQGKYLWSSHLELISAHLVKQVPNDFDLERTATVPSSARADLLLIRYLLSLYFPDSTFAQEDEPSIRELLRDMVDAPSEVPLTLADKTVDLSSICSRRLCSLSPECENLLARYLFARVFSKLYFGPGLAHFSLLAGYHHLAVLVALIRIKLKCILRATEEGMIESASTRPDASSSEGKTTSLDLLTVAEVVRNLERRLASYQHTTESATVLQVFFESPSRFKRLLELAR